MKYDLGCGYRIAYIRQVAHIVFLYIGTHDDCCRWIERNRGLSYEPPGSTHALSIIGGMLDDIDESEEALKEDEYEARLMSRINDKILRKIFSGFVEK
jgi:hypothetical protein